MSIELLIFILAALGTLLQLFIITPLLAYKSLRRTVFQHLSQYADKYSNYLCSTVDYYENEEIKKEYHKDLERYAQAKDTLRSTSVRLKEFPRGILLFWPLSYLRLIPKEQVLEEMGSRLMAISNRMICPYQPNININALNIKDAEEIKKNI